MIANTPQPPYFAVIFTSTRTEGDKGYNDMADKMLALAEQQIGFLGIESVRESSTGLSKESSTGLSKESSAGLSKEPSKEALGITVSYWRDLDAIQRWKQNTEHLKAQQKGHDTWYESFKVRISKVERDYGF